MAQPKFKVGDVCRVKDYDVLLSECDHKDSDDDLVFYINDEEDVVYFYHSDKHLCGSTFTIQSIECGESVVFYRSEEFEDELVFEGGGWIFEGALELDVPREPPIDSTNLAQNLCDLFEGVA